MPRRVIAAIVASCALVLPAAAQMPPPPPAPSAAAARLAETREDLRISELTLARIQRDLDALRRQPGADPAVIGDYSIYLEKVRAMMLGHQRNAMEMEALQARVTPSSPMAPWRRVEPARFDPPVPITIEDEFALLDAELDDTLAAFDAFLLEQQYEAARRMEQLDDASSEEMTALAREAAAAVERLRDKGIDIDTSAPPGECDGGGATTGAGGSGGGAPGSTSRPTEPGEPGEPGAPGEPGTPPALPPTGEGGPDTGSAGGSGAGGSGTGGAGTGTPEGTPGPGSPASGGTGEPGPGDRPPAADDDIVARQLREAAERETDPELREKLWREYDKYKGSR